jgi:hypothetical protein
VSDWARTHDSGVLTGTNYRNIYFSLKNITLFISQNKQYRIFVPQRRIIYCIMEMFIIEDCNK